MFDIYALLLGLTILVISSYMVWIPINFSEYIIEVKNTLIIDNLLKSVLSNILMITAISILWFVIILWPILVFIYATNNNWLIMKKDLTDAPYFMLCYGISIVPFALIRNRVTRKLSIEKPFLITHLLCIFLYTYSYLEKDISYKPAIIYLILSCVVVFILGFNFLKKRYHY